MLSATAILSQSSLDTIGELTFERRNPIVVEFDNRVMIAGGTNSGFAKSEYIEFYDRFSNEITEPVAKPFPGMGRADFTQHENFVIFYNLTGVNLSDYNYYTYNNNSNEWARGKFTNTSSFGSPISSFQYKNKAVFFSSSNSGGIADVFNFDTKQWSIDTIPFEREYFETVYAENKIFFIAGHDLVGDKLRSSRVDVFNIESETWEYFHLNQARSFVNAVFGNGKIYVCGGTTGGAFPSTKLIEIFDISNYHISSLNFNERNHFSVSLFTGNKVFFAGGNRKIIKIIDVSDNSITSIPLSTDRPVGGMKGSYLNNKVYLYAGEGCVDIKQFRIYDFASETLSEFTLPGDLLEPGVFIDDSQLYFAGGVENCYQNGSKKVLSLNACESTTKHTLRTNLDFSLLRYKIENSCPGDSIFFDAVNDIDVQESKSIVINKSLCLSSNGSYQYSFPSAGLYPTFKVTGNANLTIENIALAIPGGLVLSQGSQILINGNVTLVDE